jgi:hypothetical protein
MTVSRIRTCNECKLKFATPAAWVKHRGEGGNCRPISVLPLFNLTYKNGLWCIAVPKKARR